MTSTYDHRIIQGAESGRFLQAVEAYLQGEHGFYEAVFGDARRDTLGPAPEAPQPQLAAAAAATAARPHRDAGGRRPGAAAGRPGRHLARQGLPHARPPRRATRSAGQRARPATRRSIRTRSHLTPELMRRIPSKVLRIYVPGDNLAEALPHLRETYCGTIAYEIEHIASHRQRVWLREQDRDRRVPRARCSAEEQRRAAAPADRRRRARALPAQGLPRPEAVLDRGSRHDRADARRGDRAVGRRRRDARSSSAWPTAGG